MSRQYTELSGGNLRAALIGAVTVDLRRSCEPYKHASEGERREAAVGLVTAAMKANGLTFEKGWWER